MSDTLTNESTSSETMEDIMNTKQYNEIEQTEDNSTTESSTKNENNSTTKSLRMNVSTKNRFEETLKHYNLTQDALLIAMLDALENNKKTSFTMDAELDELKTIVNRIVELFTSGIHRSESTLKTLKNKLEHENTMLNSENIQLKEQLEQISNSHIKETSQLKSEYDNKILAITSDLKSEKLKSTNLESENKKQSEKIEVLEKELSKLKSKNEEYVIEKGETLKDIKAKDDKISELNDKISTLNEKVHEFETNENSKSMQLEMKNSELESYKDQMALIKASFEEQKKMLEKQIEGYQKILEK